MADNETIEDIIAEMRDLSEKATLSPLPFIGSKSIVAILKESADRLEAAHSCERESADAKIADLQSRIKLWTDRSAELVKKCDELYADAAHRRERGDCAKLREALKTIKDINDGRHHDAAGYEINDIINDVLAAPTPKREDGDGKSESEHTQEDNNGNNSKLREALMSVKKSIDEMGAASLDGDPEVLLMSLTQVCARLSARIDTALAEPARNCEVGTAEEQADRFQKFCLSRTQPWHGCDGTCPLLMSEKCALAWAQMPYEEGGAV